MKVLGIGNALVDIMTSLEDDNILTEHNLPKGSMQLVDKETSDRILNSVKHLKTQITSGGSSANTINGLAKLGVNCGYVGVLGKDDIGKHFISDLEKIKIDTHLTYSESDSGKAIALVSPDGERTFATYLGAAIELSKNNLKEEILSKYSIVHIEGYLVQNRELISSAIEMSKKLGLKVSFDLSSYNIVEQNIDFLKELLTNSVDILFANEEEAYAFTGLTPEKAVEEIGKIVPLTIVKIGDKGSLIQQNNKLTKINPIPSNCIDTTGAGDFYASGFLYGLINGYPIEKCGEFGSLLSSCVIGVIGAKIKDEEWNKIYNFIKL